MLNIDPVKKTLLLSALFCFLFPCFLFSQESLKSVEEEYFDFLALQGLTDRPYLNYRTLSDSVWYINSPHPWLEQKLGTIHQMTNNLGLRIYGPDLFISYNTTAPYGQNDGALWQGKGFNSSLTGGIRADLYGMELTFKPQLALSQNLAFDTMPSAYESEYGYFWGYGNNIGADAPQRFGDANFIAFDWGDSEIRYTWKTLTAGFGTQAIWLGPSYLNSMLHSNNAPTYPKVDIGLRRQPVTIPRLNWYLGDVEARLWVGQLTESAYYDSDPSNDHTMFHGLSVAYAPSFLPGLTLFANRVCLVPWELQNLKFILPLNENTIEDQKASFGFSWMFPQIGFEVFGEMGIDDYVSGGVLGFIRHPFHTTVYTAGLKKSLAINKKRNIFGEIIFEFNWMEMTQDFQFQWPYSFYYHHLLSHGYTNRGQWLGNGLSPGGNSQYLAFALYYPKGNSMIFVSRNNPDSNYLYVKAIEAEASKDELNANYHSKNKANFFVGLETSYYINTHLLLSGGIVYDLIINPLYNPEPAFNHNFSLNTNIKVLF